jgi:hypothetical protein
VPFDRLAQQAVMAGKRLRHRLGMALPEARAALNVGKQEGIRIQRGTSGCGESSPGREVSSPRPQPAPSRCRIASRILSGRIQN